MVEYTPPPEDFSALNPIQRYMQKGQLDKDDYIWLGIIVLAYFHFRPQIQNLFKWWIGGAELREGEEALKAHQEAAKVKANAIRGQELEAIESKDETVASGSTTSKQGQAVNRKTKAQVLEEKEKEKSEIEKLLDWDGETARIAEEGDKADVTTWLDKWDE